MTPNGGQAPTQVNNKHFLLQVHLELSRTFHKGDGTLSSS